MLARDLDSIAAQANDPDTAQLCKLIHENYGYPVDTVLISPDLRVLGHQNVEEARAFEFRAYQRFLQNGLALARGEAPLAPPEEEPPQGSIQPVLKLTPDQPLGSVLDLIQQRGSGQPSMSFHMIDATAFSAGGTLTITVRVGQSKAAGKFELCASPGGDAQVMMSMETLNAVAPGSSDTLVYKFKKGAVFGLAAMPAAGCAEGDANAFLATITIRAP